MNKASIEHLRTLLEDFRKLASEVDQRKARELDRLSSLILDCVPDLIQSNLALREALEEWIGDRDYLIGPPVHLVWCSSHDPREPEKGVLICTTCGKTWRSAIALGWVRVPKPELVKNTGP